jgi:hypothetical protein
MAPMGSGGGGVSGLTTLAPPISTVTLAAASARRLAGSEGEVVSAWCTLAATAARVAATCAAMAEAAAWSAAAAARVTFTPAVSALPCKRRVPGNSCAPVREVMRVTRMDNADGRWPPSAVCSTACSSMLEAWPCDRPRSVMTTTTVCAEAGSRVRVGVGEAVMVAERVADGVDAGVLDAAAVAEVVPVAVCEAESGGLPTMLGEGEDVPVAVPMMLPEPVPVAVPVMLPELVPVATPDWEAVVVGVPLCVFVTVAVPLAVPE